MLSRNKQYKLIKNTRLWRMLTWYVRENDIVDYSWEVQQVSSAGELVFIAELYPGYYTRYGEPIRIIIKQSNKYNQQYIVSTKGGFYFRAGMGKYLNIFEMVEKIVFYDIQDITEYFNSQKLERENLMGFYKKMDYVLNQLKSWKKTDVIDMLKYVSNHYRPDKYFFYECMDFIMHDIPVSHSTADYESMRAWMYKEPPYLNHTPTLNLESIPLNKSYELENPLTLEQFRKDLEDVPVARLKDYLESFGYRHPKYAKVDYVKELFVKMHRNRKT